MKYELVVIESFLRYLKGAIITDVKEVMALLESEYQAHFIKRSKIEEPPTK